MNGVVLILARQNSINLIEVEKIFEGGSLALLVAKLKSTIEILFGRRVRYSLKIVILYGSTSRAFRKYYC